MTGPLLNFLGTGTNPGRLYAAGQGHPLASEAQNALATEDYGAHYELAVELLGLDDVQTTGRKRNVAVMAVVLQVNWQLEHDILTAFVSAETAGDARIEYTGSAPLVDPRAGALVRGIVGLTGYDTAATLRGWGG